MDNYQLPNESDHHNWRRALVVSQSGIILFVSTSKYTTTLHLDTCTSEDNIPAKIGDYLEVKTETRRPIRPGCLSTKVYAYRHCDPFCYFFFEKGLAQIVSRLRMRKFSGQLKHKYGRDIEVLESEFIERIYDVHGIYSNNHHIEQKYILRKVKEPDIEPDSCWVIIRLAEDNYQRDMSQRRDGQRRKEEKPRRDKSRVKDRKEEYMPPHYHCEDGENIPNDNSCRNNVKDEHSYCDRDRSYRDNMEQRTVSRRQQTSISHTEDLEVEEKCRSLLRLLMIEKTVRQAIAENDPVVHDIVLNRILV